MKLTIFGATGGIGLQLVLQALASGHQVTAVVRDPIRLPVEGPGLKIQIIPELNDPERLATAVAESDAVLSAVGPRQPRHAGMTAPATRAISQGMDLAGVQRILVVSASPLGPVPEGQPFFLRTVVTPIVATILKDNYKDLGKMEEQLAASGLDWTAVRPPRLLNKPLTGLYRVAVAGNPPGGVQISRADVAHAMLHLIADKSTFKQGVGVAY